MEAAGSARCSCNNSAKDDRLGLKGGRGGGEKWLHWRSVLKEEGFADGLDEQL